MIPGRASAVPSGRDGRTAISTQNCIFIKKKNKNVPSLDPTERTAFLNFH
jgi:hypothetical protein